jgi:hypothetical protein
MEDEVHKAFENPEDFYPTPETMPSPAALLSGAITNGSNDE